MSGPMSGPSRRTVWGRRIGFFVGAALFVAALILVWQRRETITAAFAAIGSPEPLASLTLVACVLANIALSALFLRHLLRPYGVVGLGEMHAVVAATTLLNFLPLRPGFFGRFAYHRVVNDIAVTDTAKTVVQAALISASIACYLAAVAWASRVTDVSLWWGACIPLAGLGAGLTSPHTRHWCGAVLIRYAEVFVWALRYAAAFELIDAPIEAEVALAMACVSVMATMVPFVSNGLGLREWAIGLMAPLVTVYPLALGVTAELVNRAAELMVVGLTGAIALIWLARRHRLSS